MPWCPKCNSEHPQLVECRRVPSDLGNAAPPRQRSSATLGLLPQILCVLIELPVVALATAVFAFTAATLMTPIGYLIAATGIVPFPVMMIFALSYRFHARFTTLGIAVGWFVAGALAYLLIIANPSTSTGWFGELMLLLILPSIGTVSGVCGLRYRSNPHWKYVALPGAWLIVMAYVYSLYDWYTYCGRI